MPNYNALPQELKENGLFCCWRQEINRKGRKTKVPYNPLTSRRAESNNETTFCDFASALAHVHEYTGLGIGIFRNISALDIDHCVNDGLIDGLTQDIIDTMDSPTEISPSGTGVRIIFKTPGFKFDKARYYISNQKIGLEVYVSGATNKYVTVTGDAIHTAEFGERGQQLQAVLDKYMKRPSAEKASTEVDAPQSYLLDESVIEKARAAKNGEAFSMLWRGDYSAYGSQSEADMALASILAFWCGRDTAQMNRLFRCSGLMRDKWNRSQSGSTYGALTLERAAAMVSETYKPQSPKTSEEQGTVRSETLAQLRPEESNGIYPWTDIGASRLFADCFKLEARYIPERKMWYCYDGKRWVPDVGNLKAMELCKSLADGLLMYSKGITDEHLRTAFISYCNKWQTRRYRDIVLRDAQGIYPIEMSEFDSNRYAFNCANGTLFLDTMEFLPHNSEDKLTKISDVQYDPEARSERWTQFIAEIMSEDSEKVRYLQKAMGYGLTGNTSLECLFILYGATTRNGKGTLCESVLKALGGYGCTARPETISLKPNANSSNPSEDIARLAGSRFANISEPSKALILNAAQVKSMTGGDTLNARFLHENSFDFSPQFKIYINTNYLPIINDMTVFSSGRVIIIPFEKHFGESMQDTSLKPLFRKDKNQSAILNWLIEGYQLLRKEGLKQPDAVKIATDSYRHDSDKIALFVEEELIADPNGEERTAVVYDSYQRWCVTNGFYCENQRNFNRELATVARVEQNQRPRSKGNPTTLLRGYRLAGMVELSDMD